MADTSAARVRPAACRCLLALSILGALALLAACTELEDLVAPVISGFTATPAAIDPGDTASLTWNVTGATTLHLLPDDIDLTNQTSWTITPDTTTTYTLTASNAFGAAEQDLTVPVGPSPVIVLLATQRGLVNPGLSNTLAWSVQDADTLELRGPGLGSGITVANDATQAVHDLPPAATFTLSAANAFGVTEAEVVASRAIPAISVLITGQSNAVGVNLQDPLAAFAYIGADDDVIMLGNDYLWKSAYEPLFDCTNQVDTVNANPAPCSGLAESGADVSAGVSLGNDLVATTGGSVFLIPAAKSSTRANVWLPEFNRYDRTTLFGSAAFRGSRANNERGAPLDAIVWYQGESNTNILSQTTDYAVQVPIILNAWRDELDNDSIIVQLSRRGNVSGQDEVSRNLLYQIVREHQRRMATDARTPSGAASSASLPRTHLVVTHDLPMAEGRHLSAAGQVELGRRISLAIRQHLLSEDVDGTGPRLVKIEKATNTTIRVHTDRPITAPATTGPTAYANYFAVFSGGTERAISSIERDPADARVVKITLSQPVTDTVQVRYMPPPGTIGSIAPDVIRAATCNEPIPGTNLCLPMAAFGSESDTITMQTLRFFMEHDEEHWD